MAGVFVPAFLGVWGHAAVIAGSLLVVMVVLLVSSTKVGEDK
jgi:asparagine N-glycosylation enzyme membrane subunit Stt3